MLKLTDLQSPEHKSDQNDYYTNAHTHGTAVELWSERFHESSSGKVHLCISIKSSNREGIRSR